MKTERRRPRAGRFLPVDAGRVVYFRSYPQSCFQITRWSCSILFRFFLFSFEGSHTRMHSLYIIFQAALLSTTRSKRSLNLIAISHISIFCKPASSRLRVYVFTLIDPWHFIIYCSHERSSTLVQLCVTLSFIFAGTIIHICGSYM